jgi:hypothetical protein
MSCQGYRAQRSKNPFAKYGIKKIAIVPFYNHSSINNISGALTKDFYRSLSDFSGLLMTNNYKQADATIVGVIASNDERRRTYTTEGEIAAKSVLENELGDSRKDFYIPTRTKISFSVKVMLIRNMKKYDLDLLKSSGTIVDKRVIFTQNIPAAQSFTREILTGNSISLAHVQNEGAKKKTLLSMSEQVAASFKEMILYAF